MSNPPASTSRIYACRKLQVVYLKFCTSLKFRNWVRFWRPAAGGFVTVGEFDRNTSQGNNQQIGDKMTP